MNSDRMLQKKLLPFLIQSLFLINLFSSCVKVETAVPLDGAPTGSSATAEETLPTSLPSEAPAFDGKTIAEIQGSGHISPENRQNVEGVHGIVTAIRADGFYMQSMMPDDDVATSEGIFVYQGVVPRVKPGDEVLVAAMVEEMIPGGMGTRNLSITQLVKPSIEVLSKGNPLPPPTVIGEGGRMPPTMVIDDDSEGFVTRKTIFDPENDGLDFYESLEGMRVQVNDAVVVGATNPYKEIVVLSDGGVNASVRTPRGGIVIRENDFNPERIILDDSLRQLPFVQTGDYAVDPIIGVMDYSYGNFKLQATESVAFLSGGLMPDPPLSQAFPGEIRIVSYNVRNLSARDSDRIAVLADQIVNHLASPDIIGFQEIQDNDGVLGAVTPVADETYQGIIDAVTHLGGPHYRFVNIDPLPDLDGGVPGGNIRVGFLYRTDTGLTLADAPHGDAVTAVEISNRGGMPALSLNPGRIEPNNQAFNDSRKPLVVSFYIGKEPLFIINNHFNSKGGDSALFGELQPPVLESEVQRLKQAQLVHDFAAEILAIAPQSLVVVMGDLNDFQFSAPLRVLEGEILTNLIKTLPIDSQYTYVYDGNSQALDHLLISDGLESRLVSMQVSHINSEFDYQQRFSDHEVLIATFDFN